MYNQFGLMLVLLISLLTGIGILIYVYAKSMQRMKQQFLETGTYPKRYFNMLGSLYGIPISILLIVLLFRFTQAENDLILIFFLGLAAFIPGQIIGFILETIRKKKQIPEKNIEVKKKSVIPLLVMLFMLITFILMVIDLNK